MRTDCKNEEQLEAHRVQTLRRKKPFWRPYVTWDSMENRLRLGRFVWMKGNGPGFGAPNNYDAALSFSFEWKLPDLWVGAFWKGNRDEWWVWVCILPCVPFRIHFRRSYGGHIV